MRLLWPLLLIAAGTTLVIYAVGLSERCCASITRLRSRNPGSTPPSSDMSKALSTRIMTAILRFVGMYLILACRDRAVWNLYLALIRDLRFTAWIRDISRLVA